jgi:integrase
LNASRVGPDRLFLVPGNHDIQRKKAELGENAIAELKSLLEIATPEWQSLIKFGLYTGQRLGDIAWLTWSNIDTRDLASNPQER